MADIESALLSLLDMIDIKVGLKNFKKGKYEEFFRQYTASASDIYEQIRQAYESGCESDDKEIEGFVRTCKERYDRAGKLSRETLRLDMQCIMAFYVLPGLLECGPDGSRTIADKIVSIWNASFQKTPLGVADFNKINSGFKDKLFGIDISGVFGDKNKDKSNG